MWPWVQLSLQRAGAPAELARCSRSVPAYVDLPSSTPLIDKMYVCCLRALSLLSAPCARYDCSTSSFAFRLACERCGACIERQWTHSKD